VEHINRFIIQCGEAANQDALRAQLFSTSLSGSAFTWFTTLPANSILYWADLEKQFHQFFFLGVHEMKLTNLTSLRQRNDESVASFIQRFKEIKNQCYSLDCQLAEIAFQGLRPHLKERYASQEFESIVVLISKSSLPSRRRHSLTTTAPGPHLHRALAAIESSSSSSKTEGMN
jgi:hypothetical protein